MLVSIKVWFQLVLVSIKAFTKCALAFTSTGSLIVSSADFETSQLLTVKKFVKVGSFSKELCLIFSVLNFFAFLDILLLVHFFVV